MKNKLLAIVAASVLPLGLAVSASASTTADHQVTYTVAEARSISVAVNGSGPAVEFGAIGQTGTKTLAGAVTVTFSTPSTPTAAEFIEVMLVDSDGLSATLPTGVIMTASAQAISGTTAAIAGLNQDLSTGSGKILYGDFEETHLNETFDVDFTLTTTTAAAASGSYVIKYTLQD
jgi:hypothetical protein